MKYIKVYLIILIITSFIYYKFNKNEDILFEDKLSMFILIKHHNNIDDILFDLSSQVESFDEYIANVYYSKNNDFLIKNKFKSRIDYDYINYNSLLNSSSIVDFNNKLADVIEQYFLNDHSLLIKEKEYLLRDFLIRFYDYFKSQVDIFNQKNIFLESKTPLENFLLKCKYTTDYKKEYYLMRIEFLNRESIDNYQKQGMDSILNSILNYNSKTFNSELFLYNPYLSDSLDLNLGFDLKQYIREFNTVEEAIQCHKDLMLIEDVFLIESIYDYYLTSVDDSMDYRSLESFKLSPAILDSSYHVDQSDYKRSLLDIEEKLIELQQDNLSDDTTIASILYNLIGDGYKQGDYSMYINLINADSDYLVHNLNRLFCYELQSLFEKVDQAEKEFNISLLPIEVKKHLLPNNIFKVRYFIK